MAVTKEQVLAQLATVDDPELHQDLVSLEMIKDVTIDGGVVTVGVELTTPACPMRHKIGDDVRQALEAIDGVTDVKIDWSAQVRRSAQEVAQEENPLPNVRHIIAVGSGKGGVGKSTVTVNLAVGLARSGASVGVLDGDIYGPSLPTLLGLADQTASATAEEKFVPFQAHGVKAITIGKLVAPDRPLIMRGPMAHNAFRQLAVDTDWGELDYLLIDLPPGTGDVPLTMSQILPLTGAVVVCTPQKVAQDDAVRAIRMFEQMEIPVLGVVENMSYFVGDDGKEYDLFGRGGAEAMARTMGLPALGCLPISMALRQNSDAGDPTANFAGDDPLKRALEQLVGNTAGRISMAALAGQLKVVNA